MQLTKEYLEKQLSDAKANSANLYLQRQNCEITLAQLNGRKTQIEMEMISVDGSINTLTSLLEELDKKEPNGNQ